MILSPMERHPSDAQRAADRFAELAVVEYTIALLNYETNVIEGDRLMTLARQDAFDTPVTHRPPRTLL